MNKTVLFVTISMSGGGTERVISLLANHMSKQGNDVTIAMIGGDECVYDISDRVRLLRLVGKTGGSLLGKLKRISSLRKTIKEGDRNVIAMGSVCGLYCSVASIGIRGVRLLISERNMPDRINKKPYPTWLKTVRNILYAGAYRIVLQTEDSLECFPASIRKRCVIIGNPLDTGMRAPYTGIRSHRIVTAGRLTDDKNFELLIDAFADFSADHDDYMLEIYGSGEKEEELKKHIEKKALTDRVRMIPFVENVHDRIADARMYVSSSDSEGISNSIMEALALGIPVIATDCPIGGSRMLVHDGENGYLTDVGDKAGIINSMRKIAGDDQLCGRLSENAIRIREEFSIEQIDNKWQELLS